MDAVVESVRSLWISLDGVALLVPNVAIAEVFEPEALLDVEDGPEWLSGSVRWRGQEIPVVSMESLCGYESRGGAGKARICVINSLLAESGMPFYAMSATAIPRLVNVEAGTLGESLVATGDDLPDTVADLVRMDGGEAVIPNLPVIQRMVESAWSAIER
jgi:chemosensory pili system protein ChpC